jgi:hypothetical protein
MLATTSCTSNASRSDRPIVSNTATMTNAQRSSPMVNAASFDVSVLFPSLTPSLMMILMEGDDPILSTSLVLL